MKASRGLLILSIILYVASLFLPSVNNAPGWFILLIGFFTIFLSPANATWLANPVLYAAWIAACIDQRKAVIILGGLALAIGVVFMVLSARVLVDESGVLRPVQYVGAGYWFWLMSMVVAGFAAIDRLPRTSNSYRSLSGRKY